MDNTFDHCFKMVFTVALARLGRSSQSLGLAVFLPLEWWDVLAHDPGAFSACNRRSEEQERRKKDRKKDYVVLLCSLTLLRPIEEFLHVLACFNRLRAGTRPGASKEPDILNTIWFKSPLYKSATKAQGSAPGVDETLAQKHGGVGQSTKYIGSSGLVAGTDAQLRVRWAPGFRFLHSFDCQALPTKHEIPMTTRSFHHTSSVLKHMQQSHREVFERQSASNNTIQCRTTHGSQSKQNILCSAARSLSPSKKVKLMCDYDSVNRRDSFGHLQCFKATSGYTGAGDIIGLECSSLGAENCGSSFLRVD